MSNDGFVNIECTSTPFIREAKFSAERGGQLSELLTGEHGASIADVSHGFCYSAIDDGTGQKLTVVEIIEHDDSREWHSPPLFEIQNVGSIDSGFDLKRLLIAAGVVHTYLNNGVEIVADRFYAIVPFDDVSLVDIFNEFGAVLVGAIPNAILEARAKIDPSFRSDEHHSFELGTAAGRKAAEVLLDEVSRPFRQSDSARDRKRTANIKFNFGLIARNRFAMVCRMAHGFFD